MRYSLAALVALCACTRVAPNVQQSGAHTDPRVLTREQLLSGGAANVYDAISKVRPQCFQSRTPSNVGQRLVRDTTSETAAAAVQYNSATRAMTLYVDGPRVGTTDDLRTMSLADVLQGECLNATDAAQRFGLNNVAGAIAVKTGRK
jgi:hypothetical protein